MKKKDLNMASSLQYSPGYSLSDGAFDNMEERLAMVGLTLENVVQMDCLFRDVYNIPVMEQVIKERFNGKYPARKSIQTNFAHVGGPDGLHFQADAIAYCG